MEELWEFFAGKEARHYRRTFSRVGLALLLMLLLPVGAQLLLQYLLQLWAPALLENVLSLYILSAGTTYAIGFPVAMLVLRTIPAGEKELGGQRLSPSAWVGLWLLALGWLYLANLVTLALMDGLTVLRGSPIPNPLDTVAELPVAFQLVYSCLLAPVCEELCFRGVLLRRLRPWGDGFALCASALLFAMAHANLYQMLYAFAVGMVLGGGALRTGSLKGCMLLHAGVNLISAGLLPLAGMFGAAGELIVTVLVLGAMLWALYGTFFRGRQALLSFAARAGWGDGETWGHFWVNPGMTLFVLAVVWLVYLVMGG